MPPAEAVRRFLSFYGPAKPADFAAWSGVTRPHARRLWDEVAGELAEAGRGTWLLASDVGALQSPPQATGLRLIPPGDPYLQKPNRPLLAPDAELRKRLFRPVASPGAVLEDGRLAGLWRARLQRRRLAGHGRAARADHPRGAGGRGSADGRPARCVRGGHRVGNQLLAYHAPTMTNARTDHEVVIVGAGFSGIGVAISLDRAGMRDYLIVEEGDGFGGTWYWNTLSGRRRRHPVLLATSSRSRSARTGRASYAPGDELQRLRRPLRGRVRAARPRTRFGTRVTQATFDEDAHIWELETDGGDTLTARHVIDATGVLTQPKPPDIEGAASFAGVTHAHRPLGPRPGPARQARRGDRHGRLRGPGDPRDRARRRASDGVPAHADLVPAEARRRRSTDPCRRSSAACRAASAGARHLPVVRRAELPDRRPLPPQAAARARVRGDRAQATSASRSGTRSCGQADAGLRDRLQAAELPQRVPVDLQPRQRRARDDADRPHRRARDRDRRRHRAPDRRADPGHRLQGLRPRQLPEVPGLRARRARPRGVVGREPLPGLRGRQRSRLPELLHDVRALRLQRLLLLQPGRDAGPPHRALPRATRASATRRWSR